MRRYDGQSHGHYTHDFKPELFCKTLVMSSVICTYLKSLLAVLCPRTLLRSYLWSEKGKHFSICPDSLISNDTTPSALLEYLSTFHEILLSLCQLHTKLTYVSPEPTIHSPKSIRYSLVPCKSIPELHFM